MQFTHFFCSYIFNPANCFFSLFALKKDATSSASAEALSWTEYRRALSELCPAFRRFGISTCTDDNSPRTSARTPAIAHRLQNLQLRRRRANSPSKESLSFGQKNYRQVSIHNTSATGGSNYNDGSYYEGGPYRMDGSYHKDGSYWKDGSYRKDGSYWTDGSYCKDGSYSDPWESFGGSAEGVAPRCQSGQRRGGSRRRGNGSPPKSPGADSFHALRRKRHAAVSLDYEAITKELPQV